MCNSNRISNIKKCILCLYRLFCTGIYISAQNIVDVRLFECEVGVGGITGNRYDGINPTPGLMFFIEPRFNIHGLPLDISSQISLANFHRGDTDITIHGSLSVFLDYNYRWQKVALFAGLGAGMASIGYVYPYIDENTGRTVSANVQANHYVLVPRAGVELFNHLRLTLEYRLSTRCFSYAAINLGFAFGGGYRKF